MKAIDQVKLVGGGAGAITLVATLASIHEQLITVGPWVLGVLLASCSSVIAYGGFRVFVSGRRHWLSSKAQALEVRVIEQQLRLDAEKHEWEIRALQADIHVKASRIYPNERGVYPMVLPTIVDMLPEHMQGQIMSFQPAMGQTALPERAGTLQGKQEEETNISIPTAPPFRAMSYLLTGENLPLCWTTTGPLYGTVLDLLSMAVTGKPGRGKTTALMYYVAILLSCGAQVTIWDPHGTMGELAVLNGRRLPNMPETARVTYLDRKEDIIASLPALEADLVQRDELYRPPHRQIKHPHLLLADELPLLAEFDEELKAKAKRNKDEDAMSLIRTIKRFVLEARKWNCYFIGSGQSMDAEILPTRVTENLASRIVFFSSDRRARMAGLENDAIKKYLPIIRRAGSGVMVFDCARFEEPVLGAIPMITIDDLMAFLGLSVTGQDEMEVLQPNPLKSSRSALFTSADPDVEEDSDWPNGMFSGDFDAKNERDRKVLVFPQNGASVLVERSDLQTDEGLKAAKEYRFTETEAMQFIAAYRVAGNIEKVLTSMKKGSGYKPHARELIQAHNLRQA